MKQNLLFNRANAFGMRFIMVLTMLLVVGVGQTWGEDYELVSFSDIKTNDVIIIVGTKSNTAYAMKNTGTPPTPIAVTISNSKITSTATDITFTATNNGDNTITFVSTTSGTLYCTNANNGVKIGSQTGNNTKFSFDSSVNRLKNIGQTRWLGIYNTQDWRCYTSATQSNIAGTTTTFYRKVTAAPSCTAPTISWATEPANGNVGGTMTAKANTNYPAGLTYSSSNPSVATIDASGVIEYLKVGSTTITASVTGDGTTYCNETVSASKTITVTCGSKVTINTTNDGNGSITANLTSIETCSDNDEDRKITITLTPNPHYSSDAPVISGVANATITGSGNTYTVQLPKSSNGTLNISATFKEDDKHIVTWSADGHSIKTEEVYVNEQVSVVPTISDIPEENRCGDKFVGWTTEAIPTPQDDAPGYFTTAANSPAITDNITFYAVFADYDNKSERK